VKPERGSSIVPRTDSNTGIFLPKDKQKQPQFEQHLTIAQVAELTGTSDATVRRWIASGELRAYYFGKRAIRIDPVDLRAMRQEVNPVTRRHIQGGGQ